MLRYPFLLLLTSLAVFAVPAIPGDGRGAEIANGKTGSGRGAVSEEYPSCDGADIRFNDRFSLNFQRTLRIPDDGRQYPLPPGLGSFPLYRVEDHAGRVPSHWQKEHAYFLPMYQREALWINFDAAAWKPNAVQVGVGKINALTGKEWTTALVDEPQNYLVAPDQPWLDGIKAGEGFIRQFVAVARGTGYSVEGQLRGSESEEALRIAVYEPRPGRFPDAPPYDDRIAMAEEAPAMALSARSSNLSLGAGGKMRQKVYPDSYGVATWEEEPAIEIVVYIVDSEVFHAITGLEAPPTPVDAETYTAYGFPWFDLYDEHRGDIPAGDAFGTVKSTGQLDAQHGNGGDQSVQIPDSLVITLPVEAQQDAPVHTLPKKGDKPKDPLE